MKKVLVTYTSEKIIGNQVVQSEGCTSISFQNLTPTIPATIMGDIPLEGIISFNNEAGETITSTFQVTFAASILAKPVVLIVRTYKKIEEE